MFDIYFCKGEIKNSQNNPSAKAFLKIIKRNENDYKRIRKTKHQYIIRIFWKFLVQLGLVVKPVVGPHQALLTYSSVAWLALGPHEWLNGSLSSKRAQRKVGGCGGAWEK